MTLKRNFRIFLILMISSIFFLQNCATIIRGTSQKIPVTSNPIGAKIIVDGNEMGTIPVNLKLGRKKIHNIKIEKEGFEPFTVIINRKNSMLLSILRNTFVGGVSGALLGLAAGDSKARTIKSERGGGGLGGFTVGATIGYFSSIRVDFSKGANYSLSPKELNVTLTKIEEKPQPNIILIDAESFQDINWIRIKCVDNDDEDIINLD